MKESVENIASLNAAQIITEKVFLNGEEIGYSILPKLVKRVPLEPTINDDDTINENIYFTLHNDAGQCVYVSPALLESYNENQKVIPPDWPVSKPPTSWIVEDGVMIPKPNINGGRKVILDHDYDVYLHLQFHSLNKIPQDGRRTGWYARDIISSKYAFRGTALVDEERNFPKTKDATGMFAECKQLVNFAPRKFLDCEFADYMFKNCSNLKTFLSSAKSTAFRGLVSGKEMFYGCENLIGDLIGTQYEICFHTPALKYAKNMFRNCKKIETLKNVNFKALEIMESMFDGCENFIGFYVDGGTSRKPTLYGVTNAKYAFYGCSNMISIPFSGDMRNLEYGTSMFYNCGIDGVMDRTFDKLIEGYYMFGNCGKLTSVSKQDKSTQFPNLENGKQMFVNCVNLSSIVLNFPKLTNGQNMFRGCTSLTTLENISIPELNNGLAMFGGCKLNYQSCINLGAQLRANRAHWEETIEGEKNGISIGVDSSLMNDTQVRAALGLSSTPSPETIPEPGSITNSIGHNIIVGVTWN